MSTDFRSRLIGGEKLLGTMVTLACPATAEVLADIGFDWLFVDGEHGPLETGEILAILQAVGDRAACIVRVPAAEEVPIKKVLDLGADGVIAPQVNTPEQAANVVKYARYTPLGSRRGRPGPSARVRHEVRRVLGKSQRADIRCRSSRTCAGGQEHRVHRQGRRSRCRAVGAL